MSRYTLTKSERLNKKKIIEQLFSGGARSFSLFPLRVVFLPVDGLEAQAAMMVSVSKRRFKQAVRRNRAKRQVREAYRKNKHILLDALQGRKQGLAVAFLFLASEEVPSALVEERMKIALQRITEKLPAEP